MALNIETLKTFLADSDLPEEEQQELFEMFSKANETDLEPIIQLFSEDPKWIRILADNYQAKKDAIQSKDPQAWEKIIKDEEYLLAKIGMNPNV